MKHLLIPAFVALVCSCFAQTFTPRTAFPGVGRFGAVRFVINDLVYVGLGEAGAGNYPKDFYKYDAGTNQWTQIANFPGAGRETGIAFTVNGKGYVGLGVSFVGATTTIFKDIWRYDPGTNAWTQLGDFDGAGRSNATAFVLNNSAYVGTGTDDQFVFRSDWWKYDPATDNWAIQNNLGNLQPRYGAVAYVIGTKAYLTGGRGSGGVFFSETREFNPSAANNGWVLKTTDADDLRFVSAAAFVLNNKAYLCYGLNANFVTRYDPATNEVTNLGDLLGLGEPLRYAPIAYVTSTGKGYFGLGYASVVGSQASEYRKDFWQFNVVTTATTEPVSKPLAQVQPNFSTGYFRITHTNEAGMLGKLQLSIFDAQGVLVQTLMAPGDGHELDLSNAAPGMYFLHFRAGTTAWVQRIAKQ